MDYSLISVSTQFKDASQFVHGALSGWWLSPKLGKYTTGPVVHHQSQPYNLYYSVNDLGMVYFFFVFYRAYVYWQLHI